MTDHIVDSSVSKLGHDSTELVGYIVEEVDHVLGCARELLPQLGVLCGDADRTRIEVTLAHPVIMLVMVNM
jgi:hypothetical protein